MMDDLDARWGRFNQQRTRALDQRFHGRLRAVVVETNDPLQMHRVRFKCPELHDFDLKPEDCPWAIPAPGMGGQRSGSWAHPCIGDCIWIEFEKNHPYGPIWTGFANPTRRKYYSLPSLFGRTPIPVDENSDLAKRPDDTVPDYMPADERPMSHGWNDRYGNMDVSSGVGFFPSEHNKKPALTGVDNLTKSDFEQSKKQPKANEPDSKFMARVSRYGNVILQSDVGYIWKKDGDKGEFEGDFDKDESWEIDRWKYLQRVLHEDKPKGKDQRRIMFMTRYGHKFEMRDVGWNRTRDGEFGPKRLISDTTDDQRWLKLRTKGGHLIEAIDTGADAVEDEFIKRLIVDEVSQSTPLDKEDKFGDDARQIRLVTRSGRKIVIDDRNSHKTKAQDPTLKNSEIGIGLMIKGRATPGAKCDYRDASGDPRGYFWVINESPDVNHTVFGSPLGQLIEISDNDESITVCSTIPEFPEKFKFLEDNEFPKQPVSAFAPQSITHHLILDLQREVVRLKSRAGHGAGPRCPRWGVAASGESAGLEVHDAPLDNPWVEVVDHDRRGLWFSRQHHLGIWRARSGIDMYQWFDENSKAIVIRNGTNGKVQILCAGKVEIQALGDAQIQAGNLIKLKANKGIHFQVGDSRYRFGEGAFDTNVDVKGRNIYGYYPQILNGNGPHPGAPSGQGASVSNITPVALPTTEPDNRL